MHLIGIAIISVWFGQLVDAIIEAWRADAAATRRERERLRGDHWDPDASLARAWEAEDRERAERKAAALKVRLARQAGSGNWPLSQPPQHRRAA